MKLPNIEKLDKQLLTVLRKIEKNGIKLNVTYLNKLARNYIKNLKELKNQIYHEAEHEFLIDSPKQLASVIYDELHLDGGPVRIRRTKTGRSTAASELNKLKEANPIIPLILSYREKKKLYSTYIKPLPELIDTNSRLHTTYGIETASGRLSSKNPNLQNIPVRTEEGRAIRQAFIVDRENVLVAIDYSQIELRIAAHLSGDPGLLRAFKAGEDIHAATAKTMGVERRAAKAINFGILYGQGAFGLAESLGISTEEAQEFIDTYFVSFPKLADWIEKAKLSAYKKGYAETMLGRKRFLAEMHTAQWETAAVEMMDSKRSSQAGDRALRLREKV